MEIKVNKKNGAEAEIEVNFPEKEFGEFFENALKDEMAKVEIKGFRRGQVPEKTARAYADHEEAFNKAAERAIKSGIKKVAEENEWDLIDSPKVEVKETKEGFVFLANLVFLPEVVLNNYKGAAKKINKESKEKIEKITVEEKEVEEAVNWLIRSREHHHKEGEKCEHKEEKIELTDEMVKTFGDFKTAKDLRDSIKEGIKAEKIVREADRGRAKIINEIAAEAKIDVPEVMKRKMTDNLKDELKESLGGEEKYNEYVKKNFEGKEEELLKRFEEQSLKEIRAHLVIDEIARKEKVTPEEKEIEEEVGKILSTIPSKKREGQDLRKIYDYVYGKLKNEKVFKFLETL